MVKFQPPALPPNPTSEQWKWWSKCFQDGLTINEVTDDGHKLTFLRSHLGHEYFTLLEPINAFDAAIAALDAQFRSPSRVLFARHQLLTSTQRPGELINDFVKRLKLLAQACECEAVTAAQHQELLLRDALVSGITSDAIRARLLELDNTHNGTAACIALANAIDISTGYSRNFNSGSGSGSGTSIAQAIASTPLVAAANPRSQTCFFCGRSRHRRSQCPAKNEACRNCGKTGHWATVCKSKAMASTEVEDANDSSKTAAMLLCTADTSMVHKPGRACFAQVTINGGSEACKALIDSGSTHSFIKAAHARNLKLPISWKSSSTRLADNSVGRTSGETVANICMNGVEYRVRLTVVDALVAEMIIGMDVLSQHKVVELNADGKLPKVSFTCAAFPTMNIDPPDIFSSGLKSDARPIATRARFVKPRDREFIESEIQRLLDEGIIEKSNSPWRAQAFVVRDNKPRMVIDYSETINLFTQLDAYPFTTVETTLNGIAENHYFSRIDLKSAYHQVPIKLEDRPFTAFQAGGGLYQFSRLAFGLTNAVPAFQRIMDEFVRNNGLKKTFPYLDDITICGTTREEHDANLHRFLEAASSANLVFNQDKCVFGVTQVCLLGHLIENGTKKPDPSRLAALTDFPIPKTTAQLRRLIGFFAYYAKWVPDYSNKIQPMLTAQRETTFPLAENVVDAIETLKLDIANATLAIPEPMAGQLVMETDASGTAIGAVLSQADRPIAFFSRTLSASERNQSTVEREAMAIVEAARKWNEYLHTFPTLIKTDQRAISFIYSRNQSRIKNDKLARWRLELSQFHYDIIYRKGAENVSADTMSRSAATTKPATRLDELHDSLCHPGVTRCWEYVQRHNLPFSISEVREVTANCQTCQECKPKFFRPKLDGHLIKSTRPFERLNIDIVGPKAPAILTGRRFLLVVVDEYSRFPFAFALKDITTASVLQCLRQLFSLFGTPSFIHSDRGSQFMAEAFDSQLLQWGIAQSRTTPYNPQCNGQTEKYNGVLWKAIQCVLHSRKMPISMWETVLPEALSSIRSLICTATNETPHSRLFTFTRQGTQGYALPIWLAAGKQAYMKVFARSKEDPLVQPVEIVQVINPFFARVRQTSGRVDTISTRALAPGQASADSGSLDQPTAIPTPDAGEAPAAAAPPAIAEPPAPNPDLSFEEEVRDVVLDVPVRPKRTCGPPDRLQVKW